MSTAGQSRGGAPKCLGGYLLLYHWRQTLKWAGRIDNGRSSLDPERRFVIIQPWPHFHVRVCTFMAALDNEWIMPKLCFCVSVCVERGRVDIREQSAAWWYALISYSAGVNGCHPRQIRKTNSRGLCMLNSTLLGFSPFIYYVPRCNYIKFSVPCYGRPSHWKCRFRIKQSESLNVALGAFIRMKRTFRISHPYQERCGRLKIKCPTRGHSFKTTELMVEILIVPLLMRRFLMMSSSYNSTDPGSSVRCLIFFFFFFFGGVCEELTERRSTSFGIINPARWLNTCSTRCKSLIPSPLLATSQSTLSWAQPSSAKTKRNCTSVAFDLKHITSIKMHQFMSSSILFT